MKKLLYIIFSVLILTSCDNWLDVKPFDQISEEELLKTEEGFQKLLNGIYIELNSDNLYGAALSVEMIEIMGGAYEIGTDANVWNNYPDLKNYRYGTDYWRGRFGSTWNKAYSLILNCNILLEEMEEKRNLFSENNYNLIRGEALAIRAMLHFDMLRLFGPVYSRNSNQESIPYYTEKKMTPESFLPASEVVDKVLEDLLLAYRLLSIDPIITEGTMMSSANSGGSNFARYRALRLNYYAVAGLLARVSLYGGKTADATKYALEVIRSVDRGIFSFVDRSLVTGSPSDPDRIFASEVIFALSHANRSQMHLNYFDPSRIPGFIFKMETDLFNNVIYGGLSQTGGNQDDYRNRVGWLTSGTAKYFYKYADKVNTGNIENTMIPMIRLGEMYLIAAEAQSSNLAAGTSYINLLRSNRGVSNIPTLTEDLLKYEYIRELYGEGQLFFMYKRMYSTIIWSESSLKNVLPSDQIFVVPMPDSEMDNR